MPEEEFAVCKDGCTAAVRAGWEILERGGTALDAVEAAIRVLEDDPVFNAGFGAELNSAGDVEMDAALMCGATLKAGAVGAIRGVRNPVTVARLLLDKEPVFLVGEGAHQFAEENGAQLCDPSVMITEAAHHRWKNKRIEKLHDTVGCVALDARGDLASGTSTGGTNQNAPGRVGDSPLLGCGLYADNEAGACSLTGDGESIMRVVLGKGIVDFMHAGRHPREAVREALEILKTRVRGEAGCIVIDRAGRIGWGHNSPNLAAAYFRGDMAAPIAFVRADEADANAADQPINEDR